MKFAEVPSQLVRESCLDAGASKQRLPQHKYMPFTRYQVEEKHWQWLNYEFEAMVTGDEDSA